MMILLGTDHANCRTQKSGTLAQLRIYGKTLKHYAIYKSHTIHGRFHNATDKHFLVEYHNDPYWINRLEK